MKDEFIKLVTLAEENAKLRKANHDRVCHFMASLADRDVQIKRLEERELYFDRLHQEQIGENFKLLEKLKTVKSRHKKIKRKLEERIQYLEAITESLTAPDKPRARL